MLPGDWAESRGPQTFAFSDPKQLGRFFKRYVGQLGGGRQFDRMTRGAVMSGATAALVESDYIDADWRNEFANFYAETFRPLPDRCERIHFLDPDAELYQGYAVIRPLIGRPICRTVLAPPRRLAPYVSCQARSISSPYGYRFGVRGFPFITQDSQYGVCAHAAIWMVALYFHLRFRRPRFYLSDIVEGARHTPFIHRLIPSSGLTHEQISGALEALDMPAISYVLDDLPDGENSRTIACRYLNSELPVNLLGSGHARVLIGYGADQDGGLFFVSHDDARVPYWPIQDAETGYGPPPEGGETVSWERLVVPLPGKIYLAGEAAEREGAIALRQEMSKHDELAEALAKFDARELRIRTYVTETSEYKRALRDRDLPQEVRDHHAGISCSHWVWVVELQDRAAVDDGPDCVLGEIVIDATSDDIRPNFLCANLPGKVMRWEQLGAKTIASDVPVGGPYETGCALHVLSPEWQGGESCVDRLVRKVRRG
jgi:hypothetical protein